MEEKEKGEGKDVDKTEQNERENESRNTDLLSTIRHQAIQYNRDL